MAILLFPALVTGDLSQGYSAELVDVAGLRISAPSSAEVLRLAREQLLAELMRLERSGQDWPQPTPVEALADRLRQSGAVLMLVDVQVEETPVRVNISIGDRLLRRLDEVADTLSMTRSGYIAAAVREKLREGGAERADGPASQRLFDEVAEVRRRVTDALGPESAFGRTVAELDARALEGLRMLADNVASAVKGPPRRPPAGDPKA